MKRATDGGRFLALYALANAGVVVAYTPLLTLLLPTWMARLAGPDRVAWLSLATLLGAVSASGFNLLWGWASDRVGTRRGWIAAGLAATLASYALLAAVRTPVGLVAAVIVFQGAVNLLLAPLVAWAADRVPDGRKGVLGGLTGAGPAAGALAGVVATLPGLSDRAGLAAVAGMVAVLTVPLLIVAFAPTGLPVTAAVERHRTAPQIAPEIKRADMALLWVSRLLVQTAASVLFAFLLFYFTGLTDAPATHWVARLNAATLALGFPLALLLGRASDRLGPRRPFLIGAAGTMTAGLAIMAVARTSSLAGVGYLLFGGGMSVFLPLHATFVMQLLPRRDRHGRDLGLLNLANTVPQVAATLLTATLVPRYGYATLLALLAGGAAFAGSCVFLVRGDRQGA